MNENYNPVCIRFAVWLNSPQKQKNVAEREHANNKFFVVKKTPIKTGNFNLKNFSPYGIIAARTSIPCMI